MSKSNSKKNEKATSPAKPVPRERLVFARNFKAARQAAGLTQRGIRDQTGLAQDFISAVENGRSTINLDNMAKLAAVVRTPLWKLLLP